MSFPYNRQTFLPSAPTVDAFVSVNMIGKSAKLPVRMLLDSGADCCCIPEQLIADIQRELGFRLPYGMQEVQDFSGKRRFIKEYVLLFEATPFGQASEHKFVEIHDRVGILGRSFLNAWPIVLDGPDATWGICKPGGCHRVAS